MKSLSFRSFVGIYVSLAVCRMQHDKWYFMSDQSDGHSFRRYASAILDPLPPYAVLLINYDMLWTSVRYMQQCESFRKDVISINLSMMTYAWFEHKRSLVPRIDFPGHFYSSSNR